MHANHDIRSGPDRPFPVGSPAETVFRAWIWPLVVAMSAILAGAVYFPNTQSPARALIALWFVFIGPGGAFVPLLGLREPAMEAALTVAMSLVFDALVTGTMLYAGQWSVGTELEALVVVTLVGVVLQLVIRPSRRRSCRAATRDSSPDPATSPR